jgi:hypothetical protein
MTNFRRRQQVAVAHNQKATSLDAARARSILSNEESSARDALIAGGLLRFTPKEVFG